MFFNLNVAESRCSKCTAFTNFDQNPPINVFILNYVCAFLRFPKPKIKNKELKFV